MYVHDSIDGFIYKSYNKLINHTHNDTIQIQNEILTKYIPENNIPLGLTDLNDNICTSELFRLKIGHNQIQYLVYETKTSLL